MSQQPPTLTGRQRRRRTTLRVKVGDIVARSLITVGGIGTILAVLGVCLFLVWEAAPLFFAGEAREQASYARPWRDAADARPLHLAVDDHRNLAWTVMPDGKLHVFLLATGETIDQRDLFPDRELTAASFGEGGGDAVFGFANGQVQRADITFETSFISRADIPAAYHDMSVDEVRAYREGAVVLTPRDQFRYRAVKIALDEPADLDEPSPIRHLSHTTRRTGPIMVSYTDDGRLLLSEMRRRRNLMTGQVRVELSDCDLPFTLPADRGAPDYIQMVGLGDNIFVIWDDGHLLRYDLRDRDNPRVVEAIDLVPEPGETLTAAGFMLGRHSLVTGDSLGRTRVWFRIPAREAQRIEAAGVVDALDAVDQAPEGGFEADGMRMVNAHELPGPASGAAVTSLGRSLRSRMLSVGYSDGTVRLYHVTADNLVLETRARTGDAIDQVTMTPRDDGIVAATAAGLHNWRMQPGHPAVTLQSVLQPVWYEDYTRPLHMWQSSAAADDFEPKFGLVPLIFGTLKATLYSMMFGLPLALLAAVYTSEFLHRKTRARIKPVIEMMASLPSVVLGFVAALVIAPIVARFVPAMLLAFIALPMTYLTCAYLWQLMPYRWHVVLSPWRFTCILAVTPLALVVAFLGGRGVEQLLFSGDTRSWLAGHVGTGAPGWFLLLLPVCAVVVALAFALWINPALRMVGEHWSRSRFALLEIAKFALGIAATVALAGLAGLILAGYPWLWFDAATVPWSLDPRGEFTVAGIDLSPIGGYAQRNALVVGFVMGFAIIPIIYTIAEDALSAVPDHLRSASLGAGATPWQTAIRLIVPTAMSGLFSASMIGLGRAAGETMIVLMAAGNTPVLEMNIFNGFRTLSANIAVELPEAAVGTTHYRMLFLAALVLFGLTFVVNTLAEVVRLRFRKRAFQL
ncbi:MAG: ABC transporter permease subunit [Phycisphaeraceae bacterium]